MNIPRRIALAAAGLTLPVLAQGRAALPLRLCLHLGSVMACFATMPQGQFAHPVCRGAALLEWAIERRWPNRLPIGLV